MNFDISSNVIVAFNEFCCFCNCTRIIPSISVVYILWCVITNEAMQCCNSCNSCNSYNGY